MTTDIEKIDDLITQGYHPKDVALMVGTNEATVRVQACRRGSLRRLIPVRIALSLQAYNRAEEMAEEQGVCVETWLQQKLEREECKAGE